MYYSYPLYKLKICFQSESHMNITKNKQSRKFFVSPVKFTKVHIGGFVNEPTRYSYPLCKKKIFSIVREYRPLVNNVYQTIIFLVSQPKHMLWVLKERSQ